MTSTTAPALEPIDDPELETYDVTFVDELGTQETTVTATCHDDAADQIAYDGASILTTRCRRDGDEVDHSLDRTYAPALGDRWL